MSFGAVGQTVLTPEERIAALNRLTGLLDRAEPAVRRRFLGLIDASRGLGSLEEIADLLEAGRIDDALVVTEGIAPGLSTSLEQAYASAGLSAAEVLRSQRDTLFEFNALNQRSVDVLARNRLGMVAEFSRQQREATQLLVSDAFQRGLAPIEQARVLRGSIGLTQRQAQSVQNFRSMLQSDRPARIRMALSRELRDRRFDPTIRAAAAGDRVLTPAQIDRMVDRYQERFIQFRARTIARTETVAAIHEGDLEAWNQAIDSGVVQPGEIEQTWHTAGDERVRPSHNAMNGQEQPTGEPFLSGDGNQLRFPGDPLGPASDTINCRCVVARELKRANRVRVPLEEQIAAG